jgi:hypothetical protein
LAPRGVFGCGVGGGSGVEGGPGSDTMSDHFEVFARRLGLGTVVAD